jgi:hypothetical protein
MMRSRLSIRGLLISGCAVALALAAGPWSAGLEAQSGVVYACVNPGNGNIRMVAATQACRPNETRIQWNVVGPAGVAGSIAGQLASCATNTNFTGYLVYVPGRAFSVFTAADGRFQIDNVPPGTYAISVEAGGVLLASVTNVVVGTDPVTLPHPISVCGTTCTPRTCAQLGANCGSVTDGCGGTITCGSCVAPQTCGGGGTANVCGATGSFCNPGSTQSCYTGPAGTSGVGVCHGGTTTCDPSGTAFGPCSGQVTPSAEVCDGLDNNCDGQVDNLAPNACGTPPNGAAACILGACRLAQCNVGFADCDGNPSNGCEVNTTSDISNCGACNVVCTATNGSAACANGACRVTSCNTGYTLVNGTCQPVQQPQCNQPSDCGTSTVCQQHTCIAGVCGTINSTAGTVCSAGSCSGNIATSAATCNGAGACATPTTQDCAPFTCSAGACSTTTCVAGYLNVGGTCLLAPGQFCSLNSQCSSGSCSGNVCGLNPTGVTCAGANQCLSGICLISGTCG